MLTRHYNLQFHTPAFLGDANQSGRWRTPPFKAQLRQWWRVAYAAQNQFGVDVGGMRDIEGHLFGHAWLENDKDSKGDKVAARRSKVRLRLSDWSEGKETSWSSSDILIPHPNVNRDGELKPIGAHLYLGFGPLVYKNGTGLKANAAIQVGEAAQLSIAFPGTDKALIGHALELMSLYGTVGGRSRNGWGSFSLTDTEATAKPGLSIPTRSLIECLKLDWPHAVCADTKGPCIWQTNPHANWRELMKTLAEIKINLRTSFKFMNGKTQEPEKRHWLSYPVTNHVVSNWGNNARLPNQLRFKVRPTQDGKLVGVIFHMPHLPPAEFRPDTKPDSKPDPKTLESIWRTVHSHLGAYEKPTPEIAHLQLQRIPA